MHKANWHDGALNFDNFDGGMPDSNMWSHHRAGDFFSHSSGFVVSGGRFTSNITNYFTSAPAAIPSDFRMIRLGDLDLRNEISAKRGQGMINRRREIGSARRIYSVRITGKSSDMTASVYQGPYSEEDSQRELSQYSGIRHPRFLQIYGVVRSCALHAVVFHDDLVAVEEMLTLYRDLSITFVYFRACLSRRPLIISMKYPGHTCLTVIMDT
ncbi:hypothetical protein C8R44DRAFT_365229 [Mycena epipterygia]|nr:hypothetical protein C8R44DRAFT_365229 [Mycena epipterygia]